MTSISLQMILEPESGLGVVLEALGSPTATPADIQPATNTPHAKSFICAPFVSKKSFCSKSLRVQGLSLEDDAPLGGKGGEPGAKRVVRAAAELFNKLRHVGEVHASDHHFDRPDIRGLH